MSTARDFQMNSKEFEHWCRQLNYSAQTVEKIAAIRSEPPSRKVQGRTKNVSGVYPSRKMGVTIQFESQECGVVGYLSNGT